MLMLTNIINRNLHYLPLYVSCTILFYLFHVCYYLQKQLKSSSPKIKKCIIFSFSFIFCLTSFLRAVEILSPPGIEGRRLEITFQMRHPPQCVTFSIRLSVVYNFSGTVHYLIIIFGALVQSDGISRRFFHFFKILIFWAIRGGKRAKNRPK